MTRFKIVALLILCTAGSIAVSSESTGLVPRKQGHANEEAVLRHIRPALESSGAVARIYYQAECQRDDDYPVPFPKLAFRGPGERASGVSDIRNLFQSSKKVTVKNTAPGLVRIIVGRFPETLLHTRISSLALSPVEQYDVQSAFRAVENTIEFQQSLHKLGMRGVPRPNNLPIQSPMEGLPHLPASFTNITVDGALDSIAETFGVVVVFGYCNSPPTYDLTYTGAKDW
jgi:hypothetical protein